MSVDLVGSILSMKADVYSQMDAQDEDTGALRKTWAFTKTLSCFAKGSVSSSSGGGKDKQTYTTRFKDTESIQIRVDKFVSHRDKITNIRNNEGDVIWFELNYPTNTPTVFEVVGNTPITDPFGNVLGYNLLAQRSENQTIGD
jgi:hypothetical protein